ncbi:heterodisulfide reductase, subunit B [Candidatus Aerophobetes bacterium]|uniref:Heterodisulfide reductase, subunit B n=1 Tax=Aerophobetes bacterium TaxID=2030807 RepID=A0A662DKJ2_UNCAE|nr:MAG: heterodisulfide reductase, subunit B [Candidatus Aerophobetes bacterium]
MKISYFPGCTLKTTAKNFEESALASLSFLGIDVVELPRWNCCGTVYSLTDDDLMHQIAPIRNLIRVKEQKDTRVVTLCSMCYNTLKRANNLVKEDEEKLNKLNDFMYRENVKYDGKVEVLHLLEVLKNEVGFSEIAKKVKRSLKGLRVANYYGCLLLRPPEVGLDDPEHPTILNDLLHSLGAEVIDYPYETECCGSYHTVVNVDLVVERAYDILNSAISQGAEAVVLSCPLCNFNLDNRQKEIKKKFPDFKGIPVFYFTQLLALSLGLDERVCRFELNFVNPYPLLKSKHLITGA